MAELQKRIQKNYYVLDTTKGKIKYLWPGEKPPQDSEDLVVHTGSVTLLGIVYFVFFTSFFLGIGFVAIKPNMMVYKLLVEQIISPISHGPGNAWKDRQRLAYMRYRREKS